MPYPVADPKVIERARQVLALDPLFLDTETTGTGQNDVIIEVGIVDREGNTIYDKLVNPGRPIPPESSAVNEITDEMVAKADPWPLVWQEIEPILQQRAIGIYNAEFDMRLLKQSNQVHNIPWTLQDDQAFCMMKLFAAYYGEWNPRYNGFKSHKLEYAGYVCQLDLGSSHHAIDDARLTAALLRYIASQ